MRKLGRTVFFSVLTLLSAGCLNQDPTDEDAAVAGGARGLGNILSNNVTESYVLSVSNWVEESGRRIYQHEGDDEFSGLKASTVSTMTVDYANFRVVKDAEQATNFLDVDYPGDIPMVVELPYTMFNLNSLALSSSAPVFVNMQYRFYPLSTGEEQNLLYTPTEDGRTIEVTIEEAGAIAVVFEKCPAGQFYAKDGTCKDLVNNFTITAPTYEYRAYHDKTASLRTLSWDYAGSGEVSCAIGNNEFNACTSIDAMILSVEQFNTHPTFKVRIVQGDTTVESTYDLADSENESHAVKFFKCDVDVPPSTQLADLPTLLSTSVKTLCFAAGTEYSDDSGTAVFNGTHSGITLITDHTDPATLRFTKTDGVAAARGSLYFTPPNGILSDATLAHLKIINEGPTTTVLNFSGQATDDYTNEATISDNLLENIEVTGTGCGTTTILDNRYGMRTVIRRSKFEITGTGTSTPQDVAFLKTDQSEIYADSSEMVTQCANATTVGLIAIQGTTSYALKAEFRNSVFTAPATAGGAAAEYFMHLTKGTGDTLPTLTAHNNEFTINGSGIFLDINNTSLVSTIKNNTFKKSNSGANCGTANPIKVSTLGQNYELNTDENSFCYVDIGCQFSATAVNTAATGANSGNNNDDGDPTNLACN